MKAVLGLVMAAALIAPAQAAWRGGMTVDGSSPVVRVEDGCGPGFHRGEMGRCRPNYGERAERWREERRERWREERREERWRERAGGACPRGYHLVPRDGRCWQN